MAFTRKRPAGFTLIELMIVVAIIGVLASIAVPSYLNMIRKAKATEAKSMMKAIYVAEWGYFNETGIFLCDQAMVQNMGGLDFADTAYNVVHITCGDPFKDYMAEIESRFQGPSGLTDIWGMSQEGILLHVQDGLH